jgi:uncharacterized protein
MLRGALFLVCAGLPGLGCSAPASAASPAKPPASACGAAACAPVAEQKASAAVEVDVEGHPLAPCSTAPMTGYYRTGSCSTGPEDTGTHVVCAKVTQEFLAFSRAQGNDLVTPRPEFTFPGLKPGDRWCLCALRWREALEAKVAPPVVLQATHSAALRFLPPEALRAAALR